MKILLTGARGQVGRAVVADRPADVDLDAVGRAELDIEHADAVAAFVADCRPALIVNAAAYTAVDRAESDQDGARRANQLGPANLAAAASVVGARLIHLSTDFVFDGRSSAPYRPDDEAAPVSVYGATKLAGERAVLAKLPEQSIVLRTSWVYDATGHNFVRTMLRLMRERRSVRVVADQIGVPTAAGSVAAAIWALAKRQQVHGIHHWTDAGVASWYDLAVAVAEDGAALHLVPDTVEVTPIRTDEYPTAARRPRFSVLDTTSTGAATGLQSVHWRRNLRRVLGEIARA